MKKDIHKCNTCKKEYDRNLVKRSLGDWSAPYMLGYCSARCYTNETSGGILDEETI